MIFQCLLTLISDQGTLFMNKTIQVLLKELLVGHIKIYPYHSQDNGVVEAFNKTLTKGLTQICNTDRDNWDDKVHVGPWAWKTTNKRWT